MYESEIFAPGFSAETSATGISTSPNVNEPFQMSRVGACPSSSRTTRRFFLWVVLAMGSLLVRTRTRRANELGPLHRRSVDFRRQARSAQGRKSVDLHPLA